MNEELRNNFDSIVQMLLDNPEALELGREVAELRDRLSDDNNYMNFTANGEPIQAGGNLIRMHNYERTMAKLESDTDGLQRRIETLLSERIDAQTAVDTLSSKASEYEIGVQQAQLTQDAAVMEAQEREAAENQRLLNEANENIKRIDEEIDAINDAMSKLNAEKENVTNELEDLKSRMEKAQLKNEQGEVILDKKGNPIVPIDFNRKMADERRFKELNDKYEEIKATIFASKAKKDDAPKAENTNSSTSSISNDGAQTSQGTETKQNTEAPEETPSTKTQTKNPILKFKLDRKKWFSKFNRAKENEKFVEEWFEKFGTDNEKVMDGAALDGLEKYGVYMPGGYKNKSEGVVEKVDSAPEIVIPLPEAKVEETEMEAKAANGIDANNNVNAEPPVENQQQAPAEQTAPAENQQQAPAEQTAPAETQQQAPAEQEVPEGKEESEMNDMAKDNNKKQTVAGYTEASDQQKEQAKDKFKKLKTVLLVGVSALATIIVGSKIVDHFTNDNTDTNNNDYTNEEENTEIKDVADDYSDEFTNKIPTDDKVFGDLDNDNKNADNEKPAATVQQTTPAPQPAPVTPMPDPIPVQPTTVTAGGGVTGIEEIDTTHYHTQDEIAQAQAAVASGQLHVGDTVPGTGQPVLSVTTEYTPMEYQGETQEVVPGSVQETVPNVETVDLVPGDNQVVWEDSNGNQHVEDIPEGATSMQVEEVSKEEEIPAELMGLSQEELNEIANYQDEANSLSEGGRSF